MFISYFSHLQQLNHRPLNSTAASFNERYFARDQYADFYSLPYRTSRNTCDHFIVPVRFAFTRLTPTTTIPHYCSPLLLPPIPTAPLLPPPQCRPSAPSWRLSSLSAVSPAQVASTAARGLPLRIPIPLRGAHNRSTCQHMGMGY